VHAHTSLLRPEGLCSPQPSPRPGSWPPGATFEPEAANLFLKLLSSRYERASLMNIAERETMARAIIDDNGYMTLGTADADGLPWASPVWYAPASYREFFWVSKPGARHSQNIAVRPDVGIVIFDSTVPISTGKAVYLAARAEQVTAAGEIERGMSVFSLRALERGGRAWTPDDVAPDARLRLYRAMASEQFVLSPEDERLPFHLD
jgi:Pyridoxamine 5'-phosphate oxidase